MERIKMAIKKAYTEGFEELNIFLNVLLVSIHSFDASQN